MVTEPIASSRMNSTSPSRQRRYNTTRLPLSIPPSTVPIYSTSAIPQLRTPPAIQAPIFASHPPYHHYSTHSAYHSLIVPTNKPSLHPGPLPGVNQLVDGRQRGVNQLVFASTCVKPTGQEQDTVKPEHDLHLFIDDHITFPDSAERMKQNHQQQQN
ncbi:hypothetical protein MAR_007639 [Mya arenaria]|uniref:Uncharacterized protein n=1 Tax=Mya arenaria TaxID=6604 RepID=A0ABY7DXQ4_MYAAR|nr:hypothetical protein MAR_007639 [Mya arenaria]